VLIRAFVVLCTGGDHAGIERTIITVEKISNGARLSARYDGCYIDSGKGGDNMVGGDDGVVACFLLYLAVYLLFISFQLQTSIWMNPSPRVIFRLHTAFKLPVDYTGKDIEAKSLVIKEKKTVVVCKKRAFATRFGPLTSASDGGFQPRRSAVIFAPRRGGVDEKRSSLQGKRYKSGFRVPRKSQMYHAWQKMKDAVLYRKFRFPNQTGP
jgi:hypothetical protein